MGRVKAILEQDRAEEMEAWLQYRSYLDEQDIHISEPGQEGMKRSATGSLRSLMQEYQTQQSLDREQYHRWTIDMLWMQIRCLRRHLKSDR